MLTYDVGDIGNCKNNIVKINWKVEEYIFISFYKFYETNLIFKHNLAMLLKNILTSTSP